jgi:antitoxin ParD1/3/4
MTITLSKPHEHWLREQVDAGAFPSLDAAVGAAVERMMLEDDLSDDELMWVKPLVDEGLAQLERGEVKSHEEVFAHLRRIIDEHR